VEGHEEVILLDTHVLIWLAIEPSRLSRKAAETIPSAGRERGIAISAITRWELAWLATHGRLDITGTVEAFVDKITSRTAIQPITPQIAVLANQLPSTCSAGILATA
jgi:PIN domain nuclease of toxin-antitoxin system